MLLLLVVVMVVAGCSSIAEEYHKKKCLDIMELADKHLPNNVDSTVSRSQLYFIGKYPGTTRYGIFHKKTESFHPRTILGTRGLSLIILK